MPRGYYPRKPEESPQNGGRDLRSPTGRLQYLEELLPTVPATTKAKLVELIGEIAASLGAGAGPPDPLTSEDRVGRLERIFEVCSQEEVDEAYRRVFELPLEHMDHDRSNTHNEESAREEVCVSNVPYVPEVIQLPEPVPSVDTYAPVPTYEVIVEPEEPTQPAEEPTQTPAVRRVAKAAKWAKEHGLGPTHQEKIDDLWK